MPIKKKYKDKIITNNDLKMELYDVDGYNMEIDDYLVIQVAKSIATDLKRLAYIHQTSIGDLVRRTLVYIAWREFTTVERVTPDNQLDLVYYPLPPNKFVTTQYTPNKSTIRIPFTKKELRLVRNYLLTKKTGEMVTMRDLVETATHWLSGKIDNTIFKYAIRLNEETL